VEHVSAQKEGRKQYDNNKSSTNYKKNDKLQCILDSSCYLPDAGRNCKTHWQVLAATATEIVHNTAAVSNFILSTGYCWVCEYGMI
jgi:hypothetical protein